MYITCELFGFVVNILAFMCEKIDLFYNFSAFLADNSEIFCTFAIVMITLSELQFGGMLVMAMLALMLVACVPRRSNCHEGFFQARWLMVGGTIIIAIQFLLQLMLGFRQMGVTQGVLLNLLLFMPASMLISVALLSVQRKGRVGLADWLFGCILFGIAVLVLGLTVQLDNVPIEKESQALRQAEYVVALLFICMQCWFFRLHYKGFKRLQLAVDEYFDRERSDLLGWMGRSVTMLAFLSLFVPVALFFEGWPFKLFSVAFFFVYAYCVVSLYSYGISERLMRVEEADGNGKSCNETTNDKEDETSDDDTTDDIPLTEVQQQRIAEAVETWIASGAFRQHGLTLSVVARQMKVPTKHLRLWFRYSEYGKLAELATRLRIDEAKRVLLEHHDWSAEAVADYCGFNSREYFHRIFRQRLGMTPSKYQKMHGVATL